LIYFVRFALLHSREEYSTVKYRSVLSLLNHHVDAHPRVLQL
jgi:hypothetical protein